MNNKRNSNKTTRTLAGRLTMAALAPLVVGLIAGVGMGTASPAHADMSHAVWNQAHEQHVYVPHVDTHVHESP